MTAVRCNKRDLTSAEKELAEQWRAVRNDLSEMFKERQLDFSKASERYELSLHEDDLDFEFSYERVKKFWKKPPKTNASQKTLEDDHPEAARLAKALAYLNALRNYLLENEGLVVGKQNSDAKRAVIRRFGIDFWKDFHKKVIKRVEDEESQENWR